MYYVMSINNTSHYNKIIHSCIKIHFFYYFLYIFKKTISTRDRQVYFALVTCFCVCAQTQLIPLVKKIIITSLIVKLKI